MTKAATSQLPQPFDTLKRQFRADQQRRFAKWRKELLLALANLRDDGCAYFRRKLYFPDDPLLKDDQTILEYRNRLRKLWRREPDWEDVLHHWVYIDCRMKHLSTWSVPLWRDGTYSVEPNYKVFPLALAIATGEWMPKMGFCENPECPAPYFLKARKTQRFCERGPCLAYGQRQHALSWWRRVGTRLRAERAKVPPKRNRKARKRI